MTVVRLIDVANAAGVSRGTASNVFNAPDLVRPQLRKRVEAAARTLGYFGPDPTARVLRSGKFNAIGVVPPAHLGVAESLTNPVYLQFLRGVGEACDAVGANLVLVSDMVDGAGIKTALVDGFIFGRFEHLEFLNLIKLRRLPFAVIDVEPGADINSVRTDSRAGAYAAARHLLDLGHRKFGIISLFRDIRPAHLHPPGPDRSLRIAGMPTDQEKLKGYADALAEAALDIDSVPIVQAQPGDPDAARLLLEAAPEATAILSMSVIQAIAVIGEARRRGFSVPRDLSVAGFNDANDALRCDPPLTTVDARGAERGRIAAEIVFANGPVRHEVLQPRLIVRGSTAAAPSRWLRW